MVFFIAKKVKLQKCPALQWAILGMFHKSIFLFTIKLFSLTIFHYFLQLSNHCLHFEKWYTPLKVSPTEVVTITAYGIPNAVAFKHDVTTGDNSAFPVPTVTLVGVEIVGHEWCMMHDAWCMIQIHDALQWVKGHEFDRYRCIFIWSTQTDMIKGTEVCCKQLDSLTNNQSHNLIAIYV